MALTTVAKVRLLTNLATDDISDANITSIITEATKELNGDINVEVIREPVNYINSTRKNTRDGSNTTFYFQNWKGKYLADRNGDGEVTVTDIIVYQVDSNGTETKLTVSAVDHDDMNFTLSTAPSSEVRLYVTYEWAYKDISTPDSKVELACTLLTAAYCYAKLNIGRAPQFSVGNKKIYRHMASFDHYYQRYLVEITKVNSSMYAAVDSSVTF